MKKSVKVCVVCVVIVLLAGCASQAVPDISGHWVPLNRFDTRPHEIPLNPAYEFYAAPVDHTLRTMLARWARDSKMVLDYQHGSDFTLYEPVSRIRTTDLQDALAQLSSLFAADHVDVVLVGNAIVVRRTATRKANASQDLAAPAIWSGKSERASLAVSPASHK